MIPFTLLSFALIAALDLPRYLRAAEYKQLFLYAVIFVSAFVLCLLFALDVQVPTPAEFLLWLCRDVFGLGYGHY